jgi:pSer/pThr/pTyr-binding forkhead associated (FHA) protein
MPKPDPLQSSLMFARTSTVEMFTERWPGYFLLGQWPASGGDEKRMVFTTGAIEIDKPDVRKAAKENRIDAMGRISTYKPGITFLLDVKKSARNTWIDWLSVGRAGNNDVILRHPSVSKLHARFHVEGERNDDGVRIGDHWLTDLKSTYGTRVGGTDLEPNEPVLLKNGDYVQFGQVGCVFLDSAGLYHRLRALR